MHVHVGVIGSHGDLLEELVDQDASFDLCRDLPRLVDVDGPQHPRDGVEVLCDVVGARRLHPCAGSAGSPEALPAEGPRGCAVRGGADPCGARQGRRGQGLLHALRIRRVFSRSADGDDGPWGRPTRWRVIGAQHNKRFDHPRTRSRSLAGDPGKCAESPFPQR